MAPLVTAMCIAAGVGPSKALLALLFGAQFGGFVTLVGVGSNATANSVMSDLGITPFGFFSITPFGIGVCILGTLYFTFIGCRMIPDTGYVPEFAKTEKKAVLGADKDLAQFELLFQQAQETANKMHGILLKVRSRDEDAAGRLVKALQALAEAVGRCAE